MQSIGWDHNFFRKNSEFSDYVKYVHCTQLYMTWYFGLKENILLSGTKEKRYEKNYLVFSWSLVLAQQMDQITLAIQASKDLSEISWTCWCSFAISLSLSAFVIFKNSLWAYPVT